MAKRLTYGELFDKLAGLGYTEKTIEFNGHRQRVFQHKDVEAATIFLPDVAPDEAVLPRHLTMVRGTLKWSGLIEDDERVLP
jgi:hypothetical protein